MMLEQVSLQSGFAEVVKAPADPRPHPGSDVAEKDIRSQRYDGVVRVDEIVL